jgi:hypothetical protein
MFKTAPFRSTLSLCCILTMGWQGCGGSEEAPLRRGGFGGGGLGSPGRPIGVGSGTASFGAGPGGPIGIAGRGAGPVGAAANGGGDPTVCASALIQTMKNMPTIMFVIDGSGSMCAPFGGPTRWQALRTALLDPTKGLVYRLQSSVMFGATLYDGTIDLLLALTQPMGGSQNPPCALNYAMTRAMGVCPQLVEVLPPALNNAMVIDMAYPQTELGGSTPTDKALKHTMDALIANVQVQGPDQKATSPVYVILATDGAPNDICMGGVGGDGALQRQGVISAVDQGAAVGITTWVVSLAGGDPVLQAHLDEVAKHGDPKNPMAKTFNPTNPDDLIQTLAQLLGGAVGCNINLSGKVTVGLECAGSVQSQGQPLACCQQAPGGAWSCDGKPVAAPNGWRLSDDHSIELVGDACTQFLVGADTTLSASFPCDVFRPD